MVLQIFAPDPVLRGDTSLFAEHGEQVLAGNLPYVDFDYEHFPLTIVPAVIAAALDRWMPGINFNGAFVILSVLALLGIALAIREIGRKLGDEDAARRWILISAPMYPFVLYRADAWSVLLATLAFLAMLTGRSSSYLASVLAGIATKGWPVVLAVVDWLQARRRRASLVIASTVGLVAVLLGSPGFTSGRSFDGVHLESISGSFVLLSRLVRQAPHQIESNAGALYIGVGSWALLLNVSLGLGVLVFGLRRRRHSPDPDPHVVAVLIVGLLLASPLLSAQFLLWFTPFVALISDRRLHILIAVSGLLGTVLLGWWHPDHLLWGTLLAGRNLAFLAIAVILVATATDRRGQQPLPI